MSLPPLVIYEAIEEYRRHFESMYCRNKIFTFDQIRVFFRKQKFGHVFYESKNRDGKKDVFSLERAQRINWIKFTLEHPEALLFQGWDNKLRNHTPNRRVSVVYEPFVVVIEITPKKITELTADFVTAYVAENSIEKIKNSPKWSIELLKKSR